MTTLTCTNFVLATNETTGTRQCVIFRFPAPPVPMQHKCHVHCRVVLPPPAAEMIELYSQSDDTSPFDLDAVKGLQATDVVEQMRSVLRTKVGCCPQ